MSNIEHIAAASGFMAGLGVMLAAVLAVANRRLFVGEDPRIDQVEMLLPASNCGACGTPGCRAFAERVVHGEIEPARCTVNSTENNQLIANFLGVELGDCERQVARLACAGGTHVAYARARYEGMPSCRAASTVGGGKGCTWGCLGLGDCETVCDFGAITLNKFSLPVVDTDLCTACGDCVDICPKGLFELRPVSHRLWVACRNRDDEDEGRAHCEVACIACGRCAVDAPDGLITIHNKLAVIDYAHNDMASPVAIERCPTGAIVWLERWGAKKGSDAVRITRKEPLRMEPLPRP